MRELAGGRGRAREPTRGNWDHPARSRALRGWQTAADPGGQAPSGAYGRGWQAAQGLSVDEIDEHAPRHFDRMDLRRLPRRPGVVAPAIACLAFVLCGFGLVVLAAAQSADAPIEAARLETPAALQWVDIVRPIEIFSLTAPDLGKYTKIYQARRRIDGGGRQDMLGFGALTGDDLFLRLMVHRPGSEAAPQVSFFVDMVRRAAALDLSVAHNQLPREDATRFGQVEIGDLDLVEKDGTATPCLGFRSTAYDTPIRLIGLACGSKARPLSRPGLVCLIERLDLNSAGEDVALAHFFAAAEMKRNPACTGIALGPTPVRANWLDQADARPPLKPRKTH